MTHSRWLMVPLAIGSLLVLWGIFSALFGPSTSRLIKAHRPAVEGKLAAIQTIQDQLKNEVVPTGAAFVLAGPPPEFMPSPGKANAIVLEADSFTAPGAPAYHHQLSIEDPLRDVNTLLKNGQFHDYRSATLEMKEQCLKGFESLRYLLVIRDLQVQQPTVINGPLGTKNKFKSGTCVGDAILFDLDRRVSVGGFRISASSSRNVETSSNNIEGGLDSDLMKNVGQAIRDEFQRRYPDSSPPFAR